MKAKKVLDKLALSPADVELIRETVRDEEIGTSGEIALALTPESSDYSFRELFAAIALGAVTFAVLLPLHGALVALLDAFFWHLPEWYVTAFYGIACFSVTALFFLVANVPAIDRVLVPRAERTRAVYNRAIRHFTESGVYSTRDRTGILIFISLMEHEVRIVADSGISEKIDQEEWNAIAAKLARGIKEKKAAEAIIATVRQCGKLLTEYFPAKRDNPNELPDGLVVLEGGL